MQVLWLGGDMDARDGNGNTLICRATEKGDFGLVTTLIDIGAYFEARYSNGITILMFAAQYGNEEVVS